MLVVAAQAGDRAAMDALLRRHHQRIWAISRRLTGNDADAADATQEAMLLIVRRLGSFDGRSRFTTWAHRVATNATIDELRRRRRRAADPLADDDDEHPGATPDTGPGLEGSVADRLEIDAALAGLPEEFRVPIVLRDVAGHDYAEIAEILGLPPGTVRSRISRGRRRLAEVLGMDDTGNRSDPTERPTVQP